MEFSNAMRMHSVNKAKPTSYCTTPEKQHLQAKRNALILRKLCLISQGQNAHMERERIIAASSKFCAPSTMKTDAIRKFVKTKNATGKKLEVKFCFQWFKKW